MGNDCELEPGQPVLEEALISDDEYLERIVAGIQSVTTAGAEVNWNEVINDRQFDVVVRFRLGTLSYLVLVEVKNKTRKASASDLDAFATKAGDQNANKAVFVTVAGYQSGAIKVAKKHGIDIFTLLFDEANLQMPEEMAFITINHRSRMNEKPHWSMGEENIINQIENLSIVYGNGAVFDVPDEPSQMTYYCRKSKFSDGRCIGEVISKIVMPQLKLGQSGTFEYPLQPVLDLVPADDLSFPQGPVEKLVLSYTARKGRPIQGNIKFDPGILVAPVLYRNEITGETTRYSINSLPLGDKKVSVGSFYFIINPLAYYYC
jgi:hypothetical protein